MPHTDQPRNQPEHQSGNRRTTWRRLGALAAGVAVTFGVLSASPAQATEGTVQLADSERAVPGSYIVKLADDSLGGAIQGTLRQLSSAVLATATGLVTEYGGEVSRTFAAALPGFAVRLSEEQAARLAADPAVEYVQQNQRFQVSDVQENPPSWGLDRTDQRDLPLDQSYTYPGSANVDAYVIDTGVRTTHADFQGRAAHGYDAVDNDNDASDEHGHGTHVAGTIAGSAHGVAKDANVIGVRVLDEQGSGTTEQIVAGIDWVTANKDGPSVANMSLGGATDQALDDAVRASIESGVTYTVAAGNGNIIGLPEDAGNTSPARVPEALTVSATDSSDTRASWANYGSVVDLFAPGVDITSAWYDGDDATNTISGTSMAAPHVAGVAAQYLAANPDANPAQVAEALVANASVDKVGNPLGTANRLLYAGS
ncbi:peptidase inhibitor I9 [Tamaricihabitans halophyticus]|uniref:Peptidase inhibitor I9 n=1 Tax=Tamaricihabitans halophyticus TaxID=1262583 RepID=A0A4R2QPK1_9PSEU|nr:S8 family peptidase [Tamaricihabitans halophyticus]TCP50884.1 peptidase inhibitor I9 [Tamaricihabitans halophyticus]